MLGMLVLVRLGMLAADTVRDNHDLAVVVVVVVKMMVVALMLKLKYCIMWTGDSYDAIDVGGVHLD